MDNKNTDNINNTILVENYIECQDTQKIMLGYFDSFRNSNEQNNNKISLIFNKLFEKYQLFSDQICNHIKKVFYIVSVKAPILFVRIYAQIAVYLFLFFIYLAPIIVFYCITFDIISKIIITIWKISLCASIGFHPEVCTFQ